MSTNEPEQRKSFRCPVSDDEQFAEIRAGSFRRRVRLNNESAGGFAVTSEQPFPFKCGDLVELATAAGCYEARVIHMARPGIGDPAQRWVRRPPFQLGLERVREITRPTRNDVPRAGLLGSLPRHWLNPFHSTSVDFLALVLLVALIPAALILLAWCYQRPLMKWLSHGERSVQADSLEATIDLSAAAESASAPQSVSTAGRAAASGSPTDGQSPARPSPPTSALSRLISRRPGASAFAVPEIAERLSLDYAQKWEIRRLVEATTKALDKIDREMAQASPDVREQDRRSIQETARNRAVRLLSNQQRERWAALTGSDLPTP